MNLVTLLLGLHTHLKLAVKKCNNYYKPLKKGKYGTLAHAKKRDKRQDTQPHQVTMVMRFVRLVLEICISMSFYPDALIVITLNSLI